MNHMNTTVEIVSVSPPTDRQVAVCLNLPLSQLRDLRDYLGRRVPYSGDVSGSTTDVFLALADALDNARNDGRI